jgi:hypothetical protein
MLTHLLYQGWIIKVTKNNTHKVDVFNPKFMPSIGLLSFLPSMSSLRPYSEFVPGIFCHYPFPFPNGSDADCQNLHVSPTKCRSVLGDSVVCQLTAARVMISWHKQVQFCVPCSNEDGSPSASIGIPLPVLPPVFRLSVLFRGISGSCFECCPLEELAWLLQWSTWTWCNFCCNPHCILHFWKWPDV